MGTKSSGRLAADGETLRDGVESALGSLARAVIIIDARTTVRVRQAITRDQSLAGLLFPALEEMDIIRAAVEDAREQFAAVWQQGQGCRWKTQDD